MIKLTKPQRELLERVGAMTREISTRGNAPLDALVRHGFLECYERGSVAHHTNWYRTTPAGTQWLDDQAKAAERSARPRLSGAQKMLLQSLATNACTMHALYAPAVKLAHLGLVSRRQEAAFRRTTFTITDAGRRWLELEGT